MADARGLRQALGLLTIDTPGPGLHDVTAPIVAWTDAQAMNQGLLTIFCRHTSASLLVQENASPAVQRDLQRWIARLAPESDGYEHDDEGPDDMPAHLRTVLTGVQLAVPLDRGRLMLGTWQGIYLFEHRRRPHRRELSVHLLGT